MAKYAKEVVKQAKAWLGKNEADGSFKVIIDTYNKQKPLPRGYAVKYTDEWCATYVSAIFVKLGYTSIMPTECSCPKMIDLCKSKGIWIEDENRVPNPGDIIFYDWEDNGVGDNKGAANHVGVVVESTKSIITVIEGNYQEAVRERTISVNGKYIRGFAAPKYDKEPTTNNSLINQAMGLVQAATNGVKKGLKVKVKKGAKSYEGKKVADFIYNNVYVVDSLSGKRAVLDKKGICTAFNTDDLTVVTAAPAPKPAPAPAPAAPAVSVTYQVWDDVTNTWLTKVVDNKSYAGVLGHDICALYADLNTGDITYRVHVPAHKNNKKGARWLPAVTNRQDYAGIYNVPIDGLMMKINNKNKKIYYQVHLKGGSWLDYVTGYSTLDKKNGYAGILGKTIDAIRIYVK